MSSICSLAVQKIYPIVKRVYPILFVCILAMDCQTSGNITQVAQTLRLGLRYWASFASMPATSLA